MVQLNEPGKHCAEGKELTKENVLHDSMYMKCPDWGRHGDRR